MNVLAAHKMVDHLVRRPTMIDFVKVGTVHSTTSTLELVLLVKQGFVLLTIDGCYGLAFGIGQNQFQDAIRIVIG